MSPSRTESNGAAERGTRPKILWLAQGDPFRGSRGGDVYWQHLIARLRIDFDVVHLNRAALGLGSVTTEREYADALARELEQVSWRSPVLHDGSAFYEMTLVNRYLKTEGWGPIVSFLQEWLPARQSSLRERLHLTRAMFRFVHTVDGHVAVSGWLRDRLAWLGVPRRHVDIAWPGVPDACFESAIATQAIPASGEVTRIITAGVYHPAKGQRLLVEAMGSIARRRAERARAFKVDMYGATTSETSAFVSALQARIDELGLSDVISLHGAVDQATLWKHFAESQIFAFPAQGEGLALVVLESMLHRCVPIVDRDSAMAQLIRRTNSGIAIRPTASSLAKALLDARERLRTDSDWSRRIGAEASITAPRWPDAVERCATKLCARMGLSLGTRARTLS